MGGPAHFPLAKGQFTRQLPPTMKIPRLATILLGSALLLGPALAADDAKPAPAAEPVAAKNLLPDDAEAAWKALLEATKPPLPPAEWNQKKPSEEEFAAFRKKMGEFAGLAADKAKEFVTRFPESKELDTAKSLRVEMLKAAIQLGEETRIAELKELGGTAPATADAGAAAVPAAPDEFTRRMQEGVAKARKLESKGMEAVLLDFEATVREIMKDYPERPEVFGSLLEIAELLGGEKAKQIATEVAEAEKAPKQLRDHALGLKKKFDRLGNPVDIKFTAVDGRAVDLAGLKGKVVLVDFWATWCGPCVQELPNVLAAYEKLNPKGFEIVGISFDQDKEALEKFVKRRAMPWVQYFDGLGWGNKFGQEFGITGIPAMWLFDKQGKLRDLNARADLVSKVEKLLAETVTP